jgi:hypothetical protein
MNPEDLSVLKSIFAIHGIVSELSNPSFTTNLTLSEKNTITNLIKSLLSELRQYQGTHTDITLQITDILNSIPNLQKFDPSIY